MRRLPFSFLLFFLPLITIAPLAAQAVAPGSPEFFESRIRPIFVNNCFACHTESKMSGLRVDSREALLAGGSRGPAIVPGAPEKSVLITAVMQTDASLKMPMSGKLQKQEVEDLTAWVKAGATWPATAPAVKTTDGKYQIRPDQRSFWSFQALKKPAVPKTKDTKWAQSPIDHFVMAKLEAEGLKPVAAASKRDLLRRASLDLTGLPPQPDEIAAFEKDTSPAAFEKVVDRLLASPRYGERWGRAWLDVARFGEDDYRSLNPNPKGYFPYANAYLYRDWVIQAINDDMPYDQFVKAQLAGDLMPENVRYKMLPATGFLGLGPWYFDNGAVEVTRADERHDRVDVVTRGFLGMTVACARCHNHKYDPIPQTDYYSIAGVFRNTSYREYPRVPKSAVDEYEKRKEEIEKIQKQIGDAQNNITKQLAESLMLQTSNYLEAVWEVMGPQKKEKVNVVEDRKLDYELLDRWIRYMDRKSDRYHDKEAWQAMMAKGGTAKQAKKLAEDFQKSIVELNLLRRDLEEENDIITAKSLEGTKKKKRANKPNEFITNDDFCPGCGLRLKNLSDEQNAFWTEVFQRELNDNEDPAAMMASGRMGKPGVLVFRGWGLETRVGSEAVAEMESLKKDLEARRKENEQFQFVHGVEDNAETVDLELAIRGNPENLGDKVPRHFLTIFAEGDPEPFKEGSGRLELAEDIIKQPIAMRVIANRLWKGHFETGIVDTPSNFGAGGERPTNPELLEYIAARFEENGHSMKKMHKEMMLTSAYQLSSANDEANYAKDSGNRLYWRGNKRRMDAEQLRDSVLLASGDLENALGGPSEDLTPANKRRTVYGHVSRYKLDQFLQTFDFPAPNISAEKRFTTTVPLQRLFLMNSDFMQIEAEQLARRVAPEANNKARIGKLYELVYGRTPTMSEMTLGLDYLSTEPLARYEEMKKKAKEEADKKAADAEKAKEGKDAKGKPATETSSAPAAGAMPADAKVAAVDMPAESPKKADDSPMMPMDSDMGMGMMAGVPGFGKKGEKDKEIKYEPTTWGRYAKTLLSSSEFLFIN